jgi:hypothetical protein
MEAMFVRRDSFDIGNMDEGNQLSPPGAILMGCAFLAAGLLVIWAAFNNAGTEPTPLWVGICAGLFFMAGGGAVIVNFGTPRRFEPDGQLSPDTPIGIRVANLALTLSVVGLLGAIFAWIGFGPGEREFSMTIWTPFSRTPVEDNETIGRTMFKGFTVLLAVVFVGALVRGIRSLRGPWS